jgi:hypothetical protein
LDWGIEEERRVAMRPVVQHNGGASDAVAMLQVRVWGLLEESSPDGGCGMTGKVFSGRT